LNAKNLKCLRLKFLAEDSAEREASLALRRPLTEEHLPRGEEGLFAVRSRLMGKVPCNLKIAGLWECNIDLDADAHPLIAFFALVMSDRDEHHNFFNLNVLRLDGNEAYKRAVAIVNLAGTCNSDLDFEVFHFKWGWAV
jgi:hypothetical protein